MYIYVAFEEMQLSRNKRSRSRSKDHLTRYYYLALSIYEEMD